MFEHGVTCHVPAVAKETRRLVQRNTAEIAWLLTWNAIGLIFVELMLVTALALFFSTFSSPLLSFLLTVGLWVAGHFNADLRNFENVTSSPIAIAIARGLYYVVPNLAPFDVKAEIVYGMPVSMRTVAFTLLYAAVYISLLLTAAVAIFRRRDFK